MATKKPLNIGHRGAMGHETENTLASIQKALDLGVDAIEIDVFKIKSGETVVFHDKTVERLTDGEGDIETYSFDKLQNLTVVGGHKIPTLQDVLQLIDNQVLLNIELKGANTSQQVNSIMGEYIKDHDWSANHFIISSFNWDELREMRRLNADVAIAVLIGSEPLKAIPVGKELNAQAINPSYKTLTPDVTKQIKEAGFKIYPWTVNELEDINTMKELGVDGIITNFPERIK